MALFVYATPEVQKDAQHYNMKEFLDMTQQKLEKEQHVVGFQSFPYPYLRKRSNNFRLVASRHEFEEHVVITLLRIFVRSNDDYRAFLDDRDQFRKRMLAPLAPDDTLRAVLAQRLDSHDVTSVPFPSSEEEAFLHVNLNLNPTGSSDIIVCESHAWVESFKKNPNLQTKLSAIYLELIKLVQAPELGPGIHRWQAGSEEIAYRYFLEQHKLLLIAPINQRGGNSAQVLEKYEQLAGREDSEVADEDIGKCTRRSYPELILADEDMWIQIQQNTEANLALSFEEAQVLESAAAGHKSHEVTGFPLFINGRAGSGKSTILQYLCAEYLGKYLESEQHAFSPPAFFTYNTELLEKSKTVVRSLLKHGHAHLIKGDVPEDKDIDLVTDSSFFEFHHYLVNLLPSDLQRSTFVPAKQVTYTKFRELWEDKFGRTARARSDYGPDLSWHVIRTYIKGMSLEPDEPFDGDDYQVLPAKQKSVTPETFSTIFEKVYEGWYKGLNASGYWDAQDLAHALIFNDRLEAKFPAIFCDEAQDYTALELEVLFRLNLFSKRTLRAYMSQRVPFVFAGDPFQTLNPTGFRWDAIKANFHLKLLDNLDPEANGQSGINYRELVYNYRSTQPIVKLCNTIQAIRMNLFDVPVSPQTTWGDSGAAQHPLYYDVADASVRLNLKNQSELTIIVPADEGEEAAFVEADDVLREIVQRDEENVPRNVLSSNRAKGLEFNRVVLYGFGAAAPAALIQQLREPTEVTPEERLPLEYFVNRLYVAASRPRRRLFIVDSREALDSFWTYMIHQGKFEDLVGRLKKKEEWQCHLGRIQMGLAGAWQGDQDDPKEIAERYEREGQARHDPFHMRQAAMQYDSMGDALKAAQTRARAFLFEHKFKDAAQAYRAIGQLDDAIKAYWKGSNWSELRLLESEHPQIGLKLEVRAARLLNEDTLELAEGLKIRLQGF